MTYREQTLRDFRMKLELAKQDRNDAETNGQMREANEKINFITSKIDFLTHLRYGLFVDEVANEKA